MNERKKTADLEQVRLMDIEALCKYLSMGKKSSREFARSISCRTQVWTMHSL